MLIGRHIAVAGGGVGGIAAALALALRGAQVDLFERAPDLSEIGAGLQISPNGMAVLRALGVAERIAERAVSARAVHLCDGARGRIVTTLPLTRLADAGPWLLVHRADLVAALAGAARAAGVAFHLGRRVEGAQNASDGVRLSGPSGGPSYDLLVAADGVRSVLRPMVDRGPAASFTGQVAWRALVPLDQAISPEVAVHMGPGRHLVAYPLRDRCLLNIVAVEERAAWTPEGWTHRDDPENLRRAFAGFSPQVRGWLDQVDEVALWGLFRHPVACPWQAGRVALLGDAVHPTLPFLAQGACMALEDAWVLSASLSAADSVAAGLASYQAARHDRCVRIVKSSTFNAFAYHLRPGPLRGLAHLGLGVLGRIAPGAALAKFDWLYRHDVTG
ncbi:MAG: FAD-dependent monooxygenase [Qingshengfaniella sp.]